MSTSPARLRVGILTDGLEERVGPRGVEIANGGVGVYIRNLVRELQRIDGGPELVLVRFGNGALDIYSGPRTRSVGLRFSRWNRYARWIDLPYLGLAKRLGLDILHYPNQFGGYALPRAIRRVVTLHDLTPFLLPFHHPWRTVVGYRLLLDRSLRKADHVIVDSEATRGELLERKLVPAAKVTAIPLAAADEFRVAAPDAALGARYDLPERYVLCVGVLEPRKNHAVLVDALARLHARGDPVGLVIAGREGWGWTNPLDDPRRAALRPYVRVLRNVPDDDLRGLYAGAAVFAYPSLHEGFGLPVAEAMASGVAVVTSRTSSLPEVAGGAALLVDPRDPEDVAGRVHDVLRDPALRARLIAAGVARARELSWRRTAERTLEVYERVVRDD